MSTPTVSFVVPTRNSARTIAACVLSLRNQTYASVEVVVVDNESTDDTAERALAAGADRVVIAPWFLAHGKITDRVADFAVSQGIPMAAPLGAHRLVAETVLDRFDAALALSARTGDGLPALRRALLERAGWHASPDGVFIARTRHVHALAQAREHLARADAIATQGDAALDLLAEELRLAHDALGEITGRVTPDALLGEIFGRFCIGK